MTRQRQPEICQKCFWLREEQGKIDGFIVTDLQWCGLGFNKPEDGFCKSKSGNARELIFTDEQLSDIKTWVEEQFLTTDDNDHIVALEYVDSLLEHIKNTASTGITAWN